jgi:hypothetical protein
VRLIPPPFLPRSNVSLLLALGVCLGACGGPGAQNPQGTAGDAGLEAGSSPAQIISTLPKDVRSPPPFHLGSKRAAVRAHEDWAACHATFHPSGDAAKAVEALATACASATKTHSAAATMTGSQNATTSMPVVYKFHAQANHCYRVYAVASANVKSLVAVVTDTDGAQIAEYHTDDVTPFIAPDEALCFSANDDPKISVSVGLGDGPYAIAVWQD